MAEHPDRIIVGSEEWCSLPELKVPVIKCRVDSGARTSALHAFNINGFERDGQPWVRFEVHPLQKDRKLSVPCEAPVHDQRSVKSSSGMAERRFVIRTRVHLGDHDWAIEVTLTNRDSMGYRMLLGREAMQDRVLVDPSSSFCLGRIGDDAARARYREHTPTREGLRIAVLATDPDLYSNQRLIEAGEERGHDMQFLNIAHCTMKLDATRPRVHGRGGREIGVLDAVIPRIRPNVTIYGCALTRQFESMGVYALNGAQAIAQSRDKLFALQTLLSSGLDIPVTAFAKTPLATRDLVEMAGGAPVVVKLLEGAQGRGIVVAASPDAAESVIDAYKSLQANILLQEYVTEAADRDLRCVVVNGRVVASVERDFLTGKPRIQRSRAERTQKVKITRDERRIATRAVKALGLTVGGVDLIRSDRGPLVIEVTAAPAIEQVERATGKDVAAAMIRAVEQKVGGRI